MKCVISGGNIKILARAIQLLSKIGDEMFVQPQEDCLSFRSVNGSNSAFVDVTFQENYFSYYAYEDLDENDALKCKILIRSALAVFKTPSALDKQVESCHIKLEANSETLCFILKYKNSIIKTHLLPIIDCETIKANYKKDGTANHLFIQPRVMNDVVQNFHQTLLEITIEALQEKVLIRNYIDETSNVSNETRTQLVFGVGEFDEYTIDSDTTITFCLKELRAILHFSEALAEPINIYFDRPGRPVVFVCKSSVLETNLVLATLNPSMDTASQSTVSTKPIPVPKKAPVKRFPAKAKNKSGIKSLSKKSFNDTKKLGNSNTNSLNTNLGYSESVGRISDVSESPSQNNKKTSLHSSSICTPKASTSNFKGSKTENESNKRTPLSSLRRRKSDEKGNHNSSSTHTPKTSTSSFIDSKAGTECSRKTPLSSLLKRKSDQDIDSPSYLDNDDLIQNSPPRPQSKKAKLIFQKCFQSTFDPRMLPGYNNVEVEDSGESD